MQEAETPTAEAGTPKPRGQDPKEVAQYLPILNVRRQHADMLMKQCVLSVAIFAPMEWWLLAVQFGLLHATICAALIATLGTVVFAACYSPWQERLATYRRRNVLGYTGMFWFEGGALRFRPYENEKGWDGWTPNADPLRAIGPCPKCPPWSDEHRKRDVQPYVMIPLGGRRSSFKNEYDFDGGVYVNGRIGSLGAAGWRISFVGLSPDGNDLLVTVTDPTGTRIRCSLRQAFTILTVADQITPKVGLAGIFGALVAGMFGCGPKPVTIGDVIAFMDRALCEAMVERDAAEAGVARLTKEAEVQSRAHRELERHDAHAICLAMKILEQLDASKPTGRTIEWLHRKQRRLNDLLRLLPETHYMRTRFTEMLAATEAAIAEHDRTKAARRQGTSDAPPA